MSAGRLAAIASDLSPADVAVIDFLAEVRLATGHQLARRLWASLVPTDSNARTARRALGRLEGWRVIERQAHRLGGVRGGSSSVVFSLGPVGYRLLTARGYAAKPHHDYGQPYLAHQIAVTELIVRVAEADRAGELDLVAVETEPRCWRGFLSVYGAKRILKPDLRLTIGAQALVDHWWAEVDLSTESSAQIMRKGKAYLAYMQTGEEQRRLGTFPRVVFLVPDRRRLDQVAAAFERLPGTPERLFSVWLFDEVIGRLAAEARA